MYIYMGHGEIFIFFEKYLKKLNGYKYSYINNNFI